MTDILARNEDGAPLQGAPQSVERPFDRLASDYWEWVLRTDPVYATYLGDHRFNAMLPEIDEASRERQVGEIRAMQARLDAIVRSAPEASEEEGISRDILALVLDQALGERTHHFEQIFVDQLLGPQVWLMELLDWHPLRNAQDYADLAARYRAFPAHVDGYLENLRQGVSSGRTAHRAVVDRVIGQLRDRVTTPVESSPLRPDPARRPAEVPEACQDEVEAAIRTSVIPAFSRLLEFLANGYPARTEPGLRSLPGGEDAYLFRVRSKTSTDLTPQEIHRIGLDMAERIGEEMVEVARRAGHADFPSYLAWLHASPSHFATSRQGLLDGYDRMIRRIEARLPEWFGRLPRVRCEVKAIEEYREKDSVAGYYYAPPNDFSRPGLFYANTYQPATKPLWNMEALTVHEAVPGHHLQLALAMELDNLPEFRRHGKVTAYIEGWALYCERLCDEMGVYSDDFSRFGMLVFQAWRAARLVTDTGLHHLGWTREQAVQWFVDHVPLPHADILNEVDRYIVWPGQALSYAIGMREILRLRAQAREALGDRWDLRAFHDEILRHGDVPLTILDRIVKGHVHARLQADPV